MDIAHSSSDHATRTSLSLSQMMLLPEDEDYSKEDHQYASLTKDLDAMVNLSVDEGESKTAVIMYTYFCICAHFTIWTFHHSSIVVSGYDDEEAGYNLNYMSATLFCNSARQGLVRDPLLVRTPASRHIKDADTK